MTELMQPAKGVRRYRRPDASKYLLDKWSLSFTNNTLAKMACEGGGPPMEYAGRFPLYPEPGLDDWALTRLSPQVRKHDRTSAPKGSLTANARR